MKRSQTQPERRQIALWIISVIVVVSMVCSYTVILRPPREAATPAPTLESTAAPRPSDTPIPQTATPTATASPTATPQPQAAAPTPTSTVYVSGC